MPLSHVAVGERPPDARRCQPRLNGWNFLNVLVVVKTQEPELGCLSENEQHQQDDREGDRHLSAGHRQGRGPFGMSGVGGGRGGGGLRGALGKLCPLFPRIWAVRGRGGGLAGNVHAFSGLGFNLKRETKDREIDYGGYTLTKRCKEANASKEPACFIKKRKIISRPELRMKAARFRKG